MALRNQSGGTLSLVAISTFVLILIGACFFLLAKILGGAREAQHATDSGGLNVAKQAIKSPGFGLRGSSDDENFLSLVDPDTGYVDLECYNRLVGRSLLVAINASADGNQQGKDNANTLLRRLQGADGIGENLGANLGAGNNGGSQLTGFFSNLAGQNSTRMLGRNNLAQRGVSAAYMEQRTAGDVGATNLFPPRANQMPQLAGGGTFQIPNSWKTRDDRVQMDYVRGYAAMNVPGIDMPVVGVPVQPRHQPRLASQADFEASRNQPVAGVVCPPNAFRSAAATQEEKSVANLNTIACALVGIVDAAGGGNNGAKPKEYAPAIPDGYIRILNPAGLGAGANPTNPAAWNLFDDELDPSIGIKVGGGCMTSTDGLLEAWDRYNRAMDADPNQTAVRPPQDGLTDLYKTNGNPATIDDAHGIRLQNNAPSQVCTDRNTYQPVQGQGFPSEDPACRNLLDSGALDRAFSGDGPYTTPAGPSDNLMALEQVKCRVVDQFNTPGGIDTSIPAVTGMRLWKPLEPGVGRPWRQSSSLQRCQISEDGTLCELVYQAASNVIERNSGAYSGTGAAAASKMRDFIRQRMAQMYPDVDLQKVDDICGWPLNTMGRSSHRVNGGNDNNLLPLSDTPYFLYVDYTATDSNGNNSPTPRLAQNLNNQTPVSWRNQAPDGTPGGPNNQWRFYQQYDTMEGNTMEVINPRHEAGIHERMFQCQSGECSAEDLALITPSCGYRNILGEVKLQNRVVSFRNGGSLGQSPQFSCPN